MRLRKRLDCKVSSRFPIPTNKLGNLSRVDTFHRTIRLAEHRPNQDRWVTPPDDYIAMTDGSIAQRPYRLRTDANGFIRTGGDAPETDRPIIVLGDSVIESYWIDEDRRACAVLERLLRQAGKSIRVLNGGVTGATTLLLLDVLINKCIPLDPCGVVLVSGAIDGSAIDNGGFWLTMPELSPVTNATSSPTRGAGDRPKLLRLFKAACEVFGIPCWMATFGHRRSYDAFAQKHVSQEHFVGQYRTVEWWNQMARDVDGGVIDVAAAIAGMEGIFYDFLHCNEAGCAAVAQVLFEALVVRLG